MPEQIALFKHFVYYSSSTELSVKKKNFTIARKRQILFTVALKSGKKDFISRK